MPNSLAFVPLIETVEMARLVVPVLVTVSVWAALAVFKAWLTNVNAEAEKLATGPSPIPLIVTVCGLPPALSMKIKAALKLPGTDGVNVALTSQVLVGVSVAPVHVSAVLAKSLGFTPPIVTVEKARLTVPVLVTVSVRGALVVAVGSLGKVKTELEKPADATVPAPCKFTFCTVCAAPALLSVIVRVPVNGPLAVGEKVTLIVQEPLAGTLVPQLLVSPKFALAAMLVTLSTLVLELARLTG
jgi:hypothetical protein